MNLKELKLAYQKAKDDWLEAMRVARAAKDKADRLADEHMKAQRAVIEELQRRLDAEH